MPRNSWYATVSAGDFEPSPSPKKLRSWKTPSGVPMDSGWYCTVSIGSVLCLSAIISPSSVSAETSRQSGSVARSTASEW